MTSTPPPLLSEPAALVGADAQLDDLNPFAPAPGSDPLSAPAQVECTHCRQAAMLVSGDVIYPHRPDLHERSFWLCAPCNAYVGCQPSQKVEDKNGRVWFTPATIPLGSPANARLRALRNKAHRHFDPLWQDGSKTRSEAYLWMADVLGITGGQAHIAMFDERQCRELIEALGGIPEHTATHEASPAPALSIDEKAQMQLAEQHARQVPRLRRVAQALSKAGIPFQVKNSGHHVIVHLNDEVLDVWPSTEKWQSRGRGAIQQGLNSMFKLVSKPA